jgi:CubicO group peptidase (beta-lactamase class C family)
MLRYRSAGFALALLAALPWVAVPALGAPLSPAQQGRIDAIVRQQLAAQHVSGLTIGVGRNGRLLFARGYGLRDRAGHLPADAGTVYAIGSITKQFTASAVWLLAQRHRLDVDAPLSRYLPGIPHARRVTPLELLDQISGYRDYLENAALLTSIENSTVKPHSMAYYAHLRAAMPLGFSPRRRRIFPVLSRRLTMHRKGTPRPVIRTNSSSPTTWAGRTPRAL